MRDVFAAADVYVGPLCARRVARRKSYVNVLRSFCDARPSVVSGAFLLLFVKTKRMAPPSRCARRGAPATGPGLAKLLLLLPVVSAAAPHHNDNCETARGQPEQPCRQLSADAFGRRSGGGKYCIFLLTRDISHGCFRRCQKYGSHPLKCPPEISRVSSFITPFLPSAISRARPTRRAFRR